MEGRKGERKERKEGEGKEGEERKETGSGEREGNYRRQAISEVGGLNMAISGKNMIFLGKGNLHCFFVT